MRNEPKIWREWLENYGTRGLGVGSKAKWMKVDPSTYFANTFKSRNHFFWLRQNQPKKWVEILKEEGIPSRLGLGSADKWLSRGFDAEVFEAYKPPQSAVNNAKRGLKLREKWGRGGLSPSEARKQGIDSGVTRAKKISSGSVSRHDVRRMSAFNRHRKNYAPSKKKPDGGPTAGTIAWLLWGGTSGVDWAKRLSATMNAESFEADGEGPVGTNVTWRQISQKWMDMGEDLFPKLRSMDGNPRYNQGEVRNNMERAYNLERYIFDKADEGEIPHIFDAEGGSSEIEALRDGIKIFKRDIQTADDKSEKLFLNGMIASFEASIMGIQKVGVAKAIQEITDRLKPQAYNNVMTLWNAGIENDTTHYNMGKVAGYNEVIDYLSPYTSVFIDSWESEYKVGTQGPCWDGYTYKGPKPYAKGSCVKNAEDVSFTKKEKRVNITYPLVIGFIGGTMATVVGNVFSALYLKHKHGMWGE